MGMWLGLRPFPPFASYFLFAYAYSPHTSTTLCHMLRLGSHDTRYLPRLTASLMRMMRKIRLSINGGRKRQDQQPSGAVDWITIWHMMCGAGCHPSPVGRHVSVGRSLGWWVGFFARPGFWPLLLTFNLPLFATHFLPCICLFRSGHRWPEDIFQFRCDVRSQLEWGVAALESAEIQGNWWYDDVKFSWLNGWWDVWFELKEKIPIRVHTYKQESEFFRLEAFKNILNELYPARLAAL